MKDDQLFAGALAGLIFLAGVSLGGLLFGGSGALGGAVIGLGATWGIHAARVRRTARRQALLASPFPEEWRDVLRRRSEHYGRLPPTLQRRFEEGVQLFLSEKRVTGIGIEATDERKLLVAASAITLSVGWEGYEWDRLTEVLLYPQDFSRDWSFETAELSGQAHAWGTVILSVPSLETSFDDPGDGYHVGFHEFAHLLDMDETPFDGIPAGFGEVRARQWVKMAEREMRRLRRGWSVIDDYGADDPVEFLAVSIEAFFERPLALRRDHGELYDILGEYFRQDPAAWAAAARPLPRP